AERLGREDIAKLVDHESGEAVGFGMDEATGVGDVIELEHVTAETHSLLERGVPKGFVRKFRPEAEHAERDLGVRVVEAMAAQLLVGIVNGDEIAGPRGAVNFRDALA